MLSFLENDFWNTEKGALALRGKIENAVDTICKDGYKNIVYIAIGGTWAHAMQMKCIIEEISNIPFLIVNAGDFVNHKRPYLTKDSVVLMESVSGDTPELMDSIKIVNEVGCRNIIFIDNEGTPLEKEAQVCIIQKLGVFYKLFYTLFRFMYNAGDYDEYETLCAQMQYIPDALYQAKLSFDSVAQQFSKQYGEEPFLYLIGAGNTYGGVYSYAMCVLEEMQWIKTKSIPGNEFFHGTLEIIDKNVPVIVYKGEDYSRKIMERVENFVHRISKKVFVIDTKDFELKGILPEYRGLFSPFVVQALNERISKHLEFERRHPLDIRRYYRRLDY